MAGAALPLTKQAEHVGVLRSTCGTNLPALTSRISAHNKSLYSILSVGMARNHRGNPAASLRVEASCSAPKLFSGLATLNLSRSEQEILSVHRRLTLQQLQRLHPKTPAPALHFFSGSLPAAALLHTHQLTLVHMIASLGPSNTLHKHGLYMLHHNIRNSWFTGVRALCQQLLYCTVLPPRSSTSAHFSSPKTPVQACSEDVSELLLASKTPGRSCNKNKPEVYPSCFPPPWVRPSSSLVDLQVFTICRASCHHPSQDAERPLSLVLAPKEFRPW